MDRGYLTHIASSNRPNGVFNHKQHCRVQWSEAYLARGGDILRLAGKAFRASGIRTRQWEKKTNSSDEFGRGFRYQSVSQPLFFSRAKTNFLRVLLPQRYASSQTKNNFRLFRNNSRVFFGKMCLIGTWSIWILVVIFSYFLCKLLNIRPKLVDARLTRVWPKWERSIFGRAWRGLLAVPEGFRTPLNASRCGCSTTAYAHCGVCTTKHTMIWCPAVYQVEQYRNNNVRTVSANCPVNHELCSVVVRF